jgi:NAD(P)-dependent dehydrogenase (short-subunit alcohol dehydrogenase family)
MNGIAGAFAIVVGGSRGLGVDVANALHAAGAETVALSRHLGPPDTPWNQARVDASDESSVEHFFSEWQARFAERNLLVNFAGVRYNASLADSDPQRWRSCVDASLWTTYLMTRGFARMAAGRPGAIVNMASIHAFAAAPGRSAYAAAKAAVVQFTASSAIELAPNGIRVNCVAPGFIATDASREMIATGRLDGEAIERRTPLHRLGNADDITRAVLFLLSDESSFIVGETVRADGGWLQHAEV